MSSTGVLDAFLARLRPAIESELSSSRETRRFLVIEDATGIQLSEIADSSVPDPHGDALILRAATGAATVNFIAERQEVYAQVVLREPYRSDVRRAAVTGSAGSARLGPWEYVITG